GLRAKATAGAGAGRGRPQGAALFEAAASDDGVRAISPVRLLPVPGQPSGAERGDRSDRGAGREALRTSRGWAQQDLNLRLRPCEGRTLPLSYAPEDFGRRDP